jgi:hypothetical protein
MESDAPYEDRSFKGYLRLVRRAPGAGLKLAAACVFLLSAYLSRGMASVIAVLSIAAAMLAFFIYPYYRFHGRLPFSRRR